MAKYLVKEFYVGDVLTHEIKHKTTASNLPRGGSFIFVEGVDTKYPIIGTDDNGELTVVENTNAKTLRDAWIAMDQDIVDQAAPVFKTTNRESMLVFVDDFQLRIMVPEMFKDGGELSEVITSSFPTIGTALNTTALVKSYYSEVLYDLLQLRRQKIGTFLALKSGLGL